MAPRAIIRPARVSDAAACLAVYRPYVERTAISFEVEVPALPEFERRMRDVMARYPFLVAEVEGAIAGYVYAHPFVGRAAYDHSCETTIYLAPDKCGRGLGRRLYAALEAELAKMGILNLYACVGVPAGADDEFLTRNSANFHAHLGYRECGRFEKCGAKFGRWYSMVWMEKLLGAHTFPIKPVRLSHYQ